MKEKLIEYGTTHNVYVTSATKNIIGVVCPEIKEGFLLIGHGLTDLPEVNDKGKIVFERDQRRGHWQWYPSTK